MTININGTTGISGVDGSAGTPAIQGSDTNTGVFFGTNTIDLSTDGTSRLSIGTDGDLNVDSGTLFVDASTNTVGIGTTSPDEILTIRQDNGGGDGASIRLHNSSATVGSNNKLIFTSSTTATFQSAAIIATRTASGTTIAFESDGTNERLRIDESGDLGVGTASPNGRLDVRRDVNGDNPIFFRNMDTTSGSSAMTTTLNFNFNRTGGGLDLPAAQIRAGKEIEWQGAAANQDGQLQIFVTGNETPTERLRITSAGRFNLGAGSPGGCKVNIPYGGNDDGVRLRDDVGTGNFAIFFANSTTQVGSISHTSSATSFNETSDYRLKENIVPLSDATVRLKRLKPCRFNFIIDPTETVDGFIAHEAQDVVPEAVNGEKDAVNEDGSINPQGIDKSKLVPLLTAALQEAIGKIETLEARLSVLEGGAN